jgi:hypothetical protein
LGVVETAGLCISASQDYLACSRENVSPESGVPAEARQAQPGGGANTRIAPGMTEKRAGVVVRISPSAFTRRGRRV